MSNLFTEKSILAKLMSEENLIVEMGKTQTAYINLETRVLTIPTFKEDISAEIFDVLVSHEASHALHTDSFAWKNAIQESKIPHSVLNVVEDVRIEKLIKRKFPGLKSSYIKGYNELINMGLFGENIKNDKIEKYNVLDRINLFFKIGHIRSFDYAFNEEEQNFVDEINKISTFDQVIDISKRLAEYLKENYKENEKNSQLEWDNLEFDLVDEDSEDGEEDSDDSRSKDSDSGDSEYSGNSLDEEFDEESFKEDFDIQSEIDNEFKNNQSELYSDECIGYIDIPDISSKEVIVPYEKLYNRLLSAGIYNEETSKDNFLAFKKKSNPIVNYLVKEFELRKNANQLKKNKTAKTGDLANKKLYSYKFSEDIFKRINIVPNGKSHGLVFFLDWSGSMCENIKDTIEQLMNLVMFCQKINVPYEVYAFTSQYYDSEFDFKHEKLHDTIPNSQSKTYILFGKRSVRLMNLLSSKMTKNQFKTASTILLGIKNSLNNIILSFNDVDSMYLPTWFSLGNTPLNECIINSIDIVNEFKLKNKIQIVNTIFLTDGEGSSLIVTDNCKTKCLQNYNKVYIRYLKYNEIIKFNIKERNSHLSYRSGNFYETKIFLNLFKKCTKANLVGFYIISSRNLKDVLHCLVDDYQTIEGLAKSFRKDNNICIENYAYDEYYLVKNSSLKVNTENLEFDSEMSIRNIAKKYANHTTKKLDNRIILQKFIKKIA